MSTIDIFNCYSNTPKPREFVLPGLLPGIVGSIVSPGGAGKSFLALLMAHCIAGNTDLLGFGNFHQGRVIYFSAEDGEDVLHERLHAIGQRLNPEQREACAKQLRIEDMTGKSPNLFSDQWLEFIERLAKDSRLLIIDTLRSFHDGDENDGAQMSALISALRAVARRTRCAVVFLHHSSKALAVSGQGDLQQASRGSSVLTDNIRWQGFLVGMTSEEANKFGIDLEQRRQFVRFGISKQNYGMPVEEKWFKRGDHGVLFPIDPFMAKNTKKIYRGNDRGQL